MKKTTKTVLLGGPLVLSAFLFGAATYFYAKAIKRGTQVDLHSEPPGLSVPITQEEDAFLQESESWWKTSVPEERMLTSLDGLILKADYLEHVEPYSKAVILFHGFRQTRADMGRYAKMYADAGYHVLLPDARGHGDSEGTYIGYGWDDRLDVLGWSKQLIHEKKIDHIVWHGHSMGAATVLLASSETLPPEIKAVIADSSYSSVQAELAHQLNHMYHLPPFPLVRLTSMLAKVRVGWSFKEANIVLHIQKSIIPTFLIHGMRDELVPVAMSNELFHALGGQKELWLVPKTGHIKAFNQYPFEFKKRVFHFLAHIL